jgi:hypothetical protein
MNQKGNQHCFLMQQFFIKKKPVHQLQLFELERSDSYIFAVFDDSETGTVASPLKSKSRLFRSVYELWRRERKIDIFEDCRLFQKSTDPSNNYWCP